MERPEQSNPCPICTGGMDAGGGQAIFTAECSHTFHFHCISTSVAHGRLVCPLCNAQWRELPVVRPLPSQPSAMPPTLPRQPFPHMEAIHGFQPPPLRPADPEVFDDDDQVDPPSGHDGQRREAAAASSGLLAVKTHAEYSAVARDSSHDNFAVLVHVKAPGIVDGEAAASDEAPRAPLDLVTVLDVSGSMRRRDKLALVKQAMGFVIDNLGPDDRLSVVSFSSGARRVTRLLRMSDIGKGVASEAVESLTAGGCTNIAEGLRTAAKVLGERRYRNAVSSVILLSDGQDNYTVRRTRGIRITSVKSGRYESRVDEDGRSASVAVGELYADEERRFLLFLAVPAADGDSETTLIKVSCGYREAAGGAHVDVTAEDAVVARPEHAVDAERSAEVERERVRVEAIEDIAAARAAAERGAHQEAVGILGNRRRAVARTAAARGGDPTSAALGTELRFMCKRVATRESYRESGRAYVLAGLSSHEQQRATSRQLRSLRQPLAGSDGGGGEAMNSVAAAFAQAPPAVGAGDMEVTYLMDYLGGGGPGGEAGASSAAAIEGVPENEPEGTSSYLTPAMRAMLLRSRRAREASSEQQQQDQQPKAADEAGGSESKELTGL
ncbi:hypothetical protein C2845_PM01G02660 [Panicum miliaceum]|uniref:Uncharacterized protein n=1 Tax=Panicum miliaceum TaxID=4540 RepID=A0A3L6TKN3_PANMI|nr:hypothetical protein C2845_PM01G02660 [Panicum miliaceum]